MQDLTAFIRLWELLGSWCHLHLIVQIFGKESGLEAIVTLCVYQKLPVKLVWILNRKHMLVLRGPSVFFLFLYCQDTSSLLSPLVCMSPGAEIVYLDIF